MFPKEFKELISQLESLPQIGEKTAERLAAYIFKLGKERKRELAKAILETQKIKECKRCFNLASDDLCNICVNKNRHSDTLAVVETSLHIIPLERAGFLGNYHVLGGLIASFANDPGDLRLKELLKRLEKEKIKEIILALDNSLEGETTAMYISKAIGKKVQKLGLKIKVSRLAQGLPTGADLEYADETTVREALRGRREIG